MDRLSSHLLCQADADMKVKYAGIERAPILNWAGRIRAAQTTAQCGMGRVAEEVTNRAVSVRI
jgi:hypothetical protein